VSLSRLSFLPHQDETDRHYLTLFRLLNLDRGFAFSGQAGNDKLVTDSLSSKLQMALHRKLFAGGQQQQQPGAAT